VSGSVAQSEFSGVTQRARVTEIQEELWTLESERRQSDLKIAQLRHDLACEQVAVVAGERNRGLAAFSLEGLLQARPTFDEADLTTGALLDRELRRRFVRNSLDLSAALEFFEQNPDASLARLFGGLPYTQVENTVLSMSAPNAPIEQRLMALEVVGVSRSLSPKAYESLLASLADESNADVLGSALCALPTQAPTPALDDARQALLKRAARHEAPSVRANAYAAVGAFGDEDLGWLLEGLKDSDASVRLTVLDALRAYRGRQPERLQTALFVTLEDSAESVEIRRQAWKNLGAFPLSAEAQEKWRSVAAEVH
jgi:hypothetical protein